MTELEKLIEDYYKDTEYIERQKLKWLEPIKIKSEKKLNKAINNRKTWIKEKNK